MASRARNESGGRLDRLREGGRAAARRSGSFLGGLLLIAAALAALVALISYQPSRSVAQHRRRRAGRQLDGRAGRLGGGPAAQPVRPAGRLAAAACPSRSASGCCAALPPGAGAARCSSPCSALLLVGLAAGLLVGGAVSGLPAGWGGALGLGLAQAIEMGLAQLGDSGIVQPFRIALVVLFAAGGLTAWLYGLGLTGEERAWLANRRLRARDAGSRAASSRAARRRARRSSRSPSRARRSSPSPSGARRAGRCASASPRSRSATATLCPRSTCSTPRRPPTTVQFDKAALERNARLLESVLDDFSVKGEIVEVRPGPVVTMYELEPASGIKASRVIQLADDIARNMSALSARVATIPGRSVIGIELPNAKRESVVLSELVGSPAFEDQVAQLPIILGKNIAGDPVVADLAPMPHLLVAGTTGSGKSVGLNCMILSLLYRLTPEQCKMILIDPKMLELSVYDDIPHLLAPVVTEPAKAIRALKWTVEQMEDRYRMMASVGVRQLSSLQRQGARGEDEGPAARPARPDRLRRRDRPAPI